MRKREEKMMMMTMMDSLFLMATFQKMKGHWKKRYESNYSISSLCHLTDRIVWLFWFQNTLAKFFWRFAQLIMPNKPPRMVVTWKSRNSVRNWKQGSGMSLCPARRRWRSWSRWWGAASGREKHLALNFYSHMLCAWWSLYPKQTTVPAQRRCHWSLREKKNVSVCQMFCLHAKFEW